MSLSKHLPIHKMKFKNYYDKWLKENDEGKCDICGKETKFQHSGRFYAKTCSKECNKKHFEKICLERYDCISPLGSKVLREKGKQTSVKRYGTEYPMQSNIVKENLKKSNLKNFGVENMYQLDSVKEKCKQTKLERYGDEKYKNPEKNKQTCKERYGVEYALQDKNIREKGKETCKKRYGVEHQSQNESIHQRQMKSGKKIKKFRDTELWYQGTFELDFLDIYHDKYPDIQRARSIKYMFEGKNKVYHPDFFIPFLNLIVEIKNSYYAKKDKNKIEAKKQATLALGYNYIMIVDKDYSVFELFLISHGTTNL